ncbi:hypothetical protein SAMN05443667_10147 [Flavobacterium gillisiae]|uniref:Uncharacterized protein n=1 Tax=Flavobacterium gillisiae TaxID=150146 RepID=A0A1H3WFH4_9FLAO|nr:hypothetical protein SAMN05443667_10147 [Flavobacterium gillisiae]
MRSFFYARKSFYNNPYFLIAFLRTKTIKDKNTIATMTKK